MAAGDAGAGEAIAGGDLDRPAQAANLGRREHQPIAALALLGGALGLLQRHRLRGLGSLLRTLDGVLDGRGARDPLPLVVTARQPRAGGAENHHSYRARHRVHDTPHPHRTRPSLRVDWLRGAARGIDDALFPSEVCT